MSQIFSLKLAIDTLSIDAQRLGVRPQQLVDINVTVHASIISLPEPRLQLTYQVQIPDAYLAYQLNWPEWKQDDVNFIDYLWLQTCLECFIAVESSADYIEINASPNGNYALYQFTNYREPSRLPPTPLLQVDGKTFAHIDWLDYSSKQRMTLISKLSPNSVNTMMDVNDLPTNIFAPCYRYKRSFGLALDQLSLSLFDSALFNNRSNEDSGDDNGINGLYMNQIHPCVILWLGEIALYFAPAHTSPPDFHQRSQWSKFN